MLQGETTSILLEHGRIPRTKGGICESHFSSSSLTPKPLFSFSIYYWIAPGHP